MATAVTATTFYTPEQIAQLQQTIPPPDYQLGKGGEGLEGTIPVAQAYTIQGGQVAVATAVPAAVAKPIFTTATGMPVFNGQTRSCAETDYDGSKGIRSKDPLLQDSIAELHNFINTYNNRPRVCAEVHGYHYETRERHTTDEEGNSHTETYTETITDFYYKLDLTEFIFP